VVSSKSVPIRLSSPVSHSSWTHRAGGANHRIQHPAFALTPTLVWSADIGQGNDRRHRITADPVSEEGRIFTLDSRATVTATSVSGATLWSRDLTPASESSNDASGGGLAVVDGQLYVTTGFGDLAALDATTGAVIWLQHLGASPTGAPTVGNGLVYVVTRDNSAWAIDTADGRVRWQLASPPSVSGIVGGAAPAIGKILVIFPFGSAQIAAAFPKGGLQVWRSSVAGSRLGRAYAQISDVSADPVIQGNVIYVGNPSGRTVAIDAGDGNIIWSTNDGATGPVWVDGGSVFLVSDRAELLRLNARNGTRIWGTQLPDQVPTRSARRQRDIYPHFGPVLAGGQLWVASGDGQLRAFDPADGTLAYAAELPAGAATRPIVVNGVMYVVSTEGQLLAFR
ncbi:MAG: outer membrane protein assembly factor BamB family protein, partial [Paracoccaceae bacterium]